MSSRAQWEALVNSFITELVSGITAVALYGLHHPRAQQALGQLAADLERLLAGEPQLDLVVLGDELFVQERPFTRASRQAPALLQRLRRRGVEHVSLRRGVSAEELCTFLSELAAADDNPVHTQPHILVGKVELADRQLGGPDTEDRRRGKGHLPAIRDRVSLLHQVFSQFAANRQLLYEEVQRVAQVLWEALQSQPNPLEHLAPWEGEERWPAVHAHNTAAVAMGMAALAGLARGPSLALGEAALLHDVGKLLLPPEVMARELELSGSELELILDHPREGAAVLLEQPRACRLAPVVALEHHLHYNGGGYPRLARPRRPHPAARLVSVAEAFSVLHTARGAQGLSTRESTMAFLAERSGTQFDPGFVGALHELVVGSPPYST